MSGSDLLRIIDERIALSRSAAVPVEVVRGTVTTVYTSTRTVMVTLDGGDTPVPVTYPMLPDDPAEGDECVVLRRRDGWLHLLDILGRDAPASTGGSELPIGTVLMLATTDDPAELLGYGTWEAFGAGRFPVGYDSGDTDFDTIEETGGAKTVAAAGSNATEAAHTHTGPSHTHTGPSHQHELPFTAPSTSTLRRFATSDFGTGSSHSSVANISSTGASNSGAAMLSGSEGTGATGSAGTGATGAGSSHGHAFTGTPTSVVPPYVVLAMWKRTA